MTSYLASSQAQHSSLEEVGAGGAVVVDGVGLAVTTSICGPWDFTGDAVTEAIVAVVASVVVVVAVGGGGGPCGQSVIESCPSSINQTCGRSTTVTLKMCQKVSHG